MSIPDSSSLNEPCFGHRLDALPSHIPLLVSLEVLQTPLHNLLLGVQDRLQLSLWEELFKPLQNNPLAQLPLGNEQLDNSVVVVRGADNHPI
jgi:hypothetical protein